MKSALTLNTYTRRSDMNHAQWLFAASRKLLKLAGVFAVIGASSMGYSASTQAGVGESGDRNTSVTIQTFQFRPSPIEVRAGTRVTWINQDDILHTVTSGTPEGRDHRFEAPLDGKGASSTVTFTQAGSYPYFCDRHQSMRGEIRVR
jgi:plastocyanin